MINARKIDFIICTNDDYWFEECVKYIKCLHVPQGYELGIIKIEGAKSMASGYNQGMHQSDAKYKLYMHHDVFIHGRDFLIKMIQVFQSNTEIGLLGVLGSDVIIEKADYWDKWNVGQVLASSGRSTVVVHSPQKYEGDYALAYAVDGMLMMTQHDVEWREDIFEKWDFYDISQCFEFQRKGYKVAVLLDDEYSTYHDCGHSKLWEYDESRNRFCKEYAEYGFVADNQSAGNAEEARALQKQFIDTIEQLMQTNLCSAEELVNKGFEIWPFDNAIIMLRNVFDIYNYEKKDGCETYFVQLGDTYELLTKKYTKYKFLVRAVEYDISEDALDILCDDIENGKITIYALVCIIIRCCWKPQKVFGLLGINV